MATVPPTVEPDAFGPWLLVSRRKQNTRKSTQPPNTSHQQPLDTSYAPTKHGKPLPLVMLDAVMSTDADP